MFRAIVSPILRSRLDYVYSLWYNAPTVLQSGNMVEVELVRCMVVGIPPARSYKNTV